MNAFGHLRLRLGKTAFFGNGSLEEGAGGVSQPERLAAPDAEQSSAERSRWLVTEKAKAAWPPHFMYCLVCFDSKYASQKALKIGGDLRMKGIGCIYTSTGVCCFYVGEYTYRMRPESCVHVCVCVCM